MTFAMVECSDGEWRPAMGGKHRFDDSLMWVFSDGKYRDRDISNSRPLVVIDPEDTEAVERLARARWEAYRGDASVKPCSFDDLAEWLRQERIDWMQAALREYANPKPPKPEEPTGLGAVVRDESNRKWVRAGASFSAPNWRACGGDEWTEYGDIRVAEVLSPGVTE